MPRCIHCQTDYGDHLRRCPACGGADDSAPRAGRPAFDIAQLPVLPGGAGNRKRIRIQQVLFVTIGLALLGVIGVPLLALRADVPESDPTTPGPGRGTKATRRAEVQPGERPALQESLVELDAVRDGPLVRVTGQCSMLAAARLTVAGRPALVDPAGDRFSAELPFDGREIEVVAHGLDGETHSLRVPVRVTANRASWDAVRIVSHADGQSIHDPALHVRTERKSGARSKVKTHPVEAKDLENRIEVEGRDLTLYRSPPGFVYLRTTAKGHRTFLRLKDRQEMVLIPAGIGYRGRDDDGPASPRHLVQLQSFLIDRTEVTCRQYARFLKSLSGSENAVLRHNDDPGVELLPDAWLDGRPPAGELDLPVRGVSWYAAWRYARWVGGRLASEAEWERAGAGPEGRAYPWGEAIDLTRCRASGAGPLPADSMPGGEGPFSLLHMSGNVREWCGDRYDPRWYPLARRVNPVGPPDNLHRVVRGGSFLSAEPALSLQARDHHAPERGAPDIGFRVVCRYLLD